MTSFQTYKSNTSGDNLRMTLHASMTEFAKLSVLLDITSKIRTDTKLVFYNRKLMRTDIILTRTTKPICNFANSAMIYLHLPVKLMSITTKISFISIYLWNWCQSPLKSDLFPAMTRWQVYMYSSNFCVIKFISDSQWFSLYALFSSTNKNDW